MACLHSIRPREMCEHKNCVNVIFSSQSHDIMKSTDVDKAIGYTKHWTHDSVREESRKKKRREGNEDKFKKRNSSMTYLNVSETKEDGTWTHPNRPDILICSFYRQSRPPIYDLSLPNRASRGRAIERENCRWLTHSREPMSVTESKWKEKK